MVDNNFEKDANCKLDTCGIYPKVTDVERGEILCSGCGQVLLQKIETSSSESHAYTQEEFLTQTRTGAPISLSMHDKGLSTIIGKNVDSYGKPLTWNNKSIFKRLRTWDSRSKSKSYTRNLGRAFTILDGIKTKLGIPETVVEKTAYIYRKATNAKLARGRSITPLICASLYASCREANTPRTLEEISVAGNVSKKVLARTIRALIKKLDLKLANYDSSSFVARLANNLDLKEKTKRDALNYLEKSKKIAAGKHPVAHAASALYLACLVNEEKISQTSFAKASKVSAVTIRNRVSLMRKFLKLKS